METTGLTNDELEKLNILLKLGRIYIDSAGDFCFNPGNNYNLFKLTKSRVLIGKTLNSLIVNAWEKFKS